jgi:hypothetical protein
MKYMEELHKRLGMKDGGEFPDLNKDGKTSYADVLIGRGVRLKKQEGGSMDDQMQDMMGEQPDMDMVPDEQMEDNYMNFIIQEALSEEEEDVLLEKLQQDKELLRLFDKVVDVAQEFAGSGPVEGPGSGISDSIPARLSDGEFVFTAKATEVLGSDNLQAMMEDAERVADEGRKPMNDGGTMQEEDSQEQAVKQVEQTINVNRPQVQEESGPRIMPQNDLVKEELSKMALADIDHVRS